MLKRFIIRYIRRHACDDNLLFMHQIMKACHVSRQSRIDDQTVPGRIYEVMSQCAKSSPMVSLSVPWKMMIADGVQKELEQVFNIPSIEEQLSAKAW